MLFQVILPTYNASRWFEDALASVVGHPHGEVLVIDDGSRDEERDATAEICSRYSGVRFFSEPHRGLVGTLNFGLSIATAAYIARMDADDVSRPNRFDKQLAFLEAHPDVAVIGGQMMGINSEGRLNGKSTQFPTSPEAISDYLSKGKNPFMHPSVMMRRDAVIAVGGYRPATEYAEDYDLWLRLQEHYPLANLDEALIRYRRHDNQITRSTDWKQKFARDLATLSARRRLAGRNDPVDQITKKFDGIDNQEKLDIEVEQLIIAYNAITAREDQSTATPENINSILSSIDAGLMGRSSKTQAKAAAKAAKLAWKFSQYSLAAKASIRGLKLNPFAFANEIAA